MLDDGLMLYEKLTLSEIELFSQTKVWKAIEELHSFELEGMLADLDKLTNEDRAFIAGKIYIVLKFRDILNMFKKHINGQNKEN
jgi:hypothetical protein